MITRFAVLPDERKVLFGIDKAGLFKPGIVYECTEMLDEIIIRPIGEYALPKNGHRPSEYSDNNEIIRSGLHLITKKEYEQLNNETNE